jgi:AAA+ ATPase superfamily predicted ATPase
MNPFQYGKIVSGQDFCGREALLKQITGYIKSSQNIVIKGERRIGKSSTIYKAVQRCKGIQYLYVDLLGIKSIDALCKRILRAIVVLEQKAGFFDKVIKTLSYLRPSISVDPITLMPTITFDASVELKANSIPEVLSLIESLHKKKRIVVVLDEFQDILRLNDAREALSLMRGKIQFQKDIPYVFAGSIRNKMDEIFTHPDSPFFKSAIPITVDPLPYTEFSEFLKKKFLTGKRRINDDVLKKVFEIAHDIPGDIQQLCEALWTVTSSNHVIGLDRLKDALELIFAREQKSYENDMSLLTDFQVRCLLTVAREGGNKVFSVSFMKSAGVNNSSSVRRAIRRMISLNILFESRNEYRFVNPFFRAWINYRGR